jgi:rhomboid protease GluP
MRRRSPVTFGLLIVIAVVFAFEWLTRAYDSDAAMMHVGAIVPGLIQHGELWRLITAMFLHAGVLHWLSNSWGLYQLGSLYEVLFGSKRFTLIYFTTGIFAGIVSSLYNHGPAVGASGAIFGLMGALIFSVRRSPLYRHQPWTRSLVRQLLVWIVINIVIGFSLPFIDNFAHIGGLVSGLALGFLPHRVPPPPPSETVLDV